MSWNVSIISLHQESEASPNSGGQQNVPKKSGHFQDGEYELNFLCIFSLWVI